jgi:hypothetical protein
MKNFNVWFDRVITKNTVLIVSGAYILGVYFFIVREANAGCDLSWCSTQISDITLPLFFPLVIIAIGTTITYLLPKKVFYFWIRFALVWTVIAYTWVALTPHYSPPSFFFSFDQKSGVAISLAFWFAIISVIMLTVHSIYLQINKVHK